jgi:hypothetical protein
LIDPTGAACWVSFSFGGRASEKEMLSYHETGDHTKKEEYDLMVHTSFDDYWEAITDKCKDEDGVAFEPGMMGDKGTKIKELMQRLGAFYMAPSMLSDSFLTLQEVERNEIISKARGHVERAIGRIKRCKILTNGIPTAMLPFVDDLVYFCTFLTLFLPQSDISAATAAD